MHATRRFSISCLALLGIASIAMSIGGCSSGPKDPFDDAGMAPQKYRDYVPPSARTVASGPGTITFTAPENGIVYLLDTSSSTSIEGVQKPKALISGYVAKGSEVVVDAQDRRVHLKGRK